MLTDRKLRNCEFLCEAGACVMGDLGIEDQAGLGIRSLLFFFLLPLKFHSTFSVQPPPAVGDNSNTVPQGPYAPQT